MPKTNQEIAKVLYEMATLLDVEGVAFKPRAYEKVAENVEDLSENVAALYAREGRAGLLKIPGVGAGIADHIEKILKTGSFPEYARLKRKLPVAIGELVAVEGVGPKTVKLLWEKLKIKTMADLEDAARAGKLRKLSRLGEKFEQKVLKNIAFLKQSGGRRILGHILPEIRELEAAIRSLPGVRNAVVAGSVRRRKATIGDIDILATSSDPAAVMRAFAALPVVAGVVVSGETKTTVRLKNGLEADLRVVSERSFGAALNYFTGSKAHNIKLREIAVKKGMKLNEYGLFRGQKFVAGETEEEVYKALGLRYIEPEMREDTGEIEASRAGKLPKLVGYGDLRGDLQVQTDWTDGANSIEEMAEAAMAAGLEYIVITDHTDALAMVGGANEQKLSRQAAAIAVVNEKLRRAKKRFTVLAGAEVNILKDGSLDIPDRALARLDVVGASVHSHFALPRSEQTRRVVRAMENPNVDIIFHLTGGIINRREPIDIDIAAVIAAARRTGTVLEIDAYPDRLDIKDEYIRRCAEAGVKMSIDSDAHAAAHFKFLEHGIAEARRGWAASADIVNTRSAGEMLKLLKRTTSHAR